MSRQISTLSIFKFNSLKQKLWAFGMMQFAHAPIKKVPGLTFYKLMGTGKPGFNPLPDWSTYAILQVWEDESAATDYFKRNGLFESYRANSDEHLVLFLRNIICKGNWSGGVPFHKSDELDATIPFIAVLTRATIKTRLLVKFWKFVPQSQVSLDENQGLLYTKGVGEVPFRQMATFSIWKDKEALDAFAYRAKGHVEAIKHTRTLKWYSEELFSRFQPYRYIGALQGVNLPADFSAEIP